MNTTRKNDPTAPAESKAGAGGLRERLDELIRLAQVAEGRSESNEDVHAMRDDIIDALALAEPSGDASPLSPAGDVAGAGDGLAEILLKGWSTDRMAIRMLVAAGYVTEDKANEALRIAHGFDNGTITPATPGAGDAATDKCFRCGAPCRNEVLMRGGDNGWGDDASRTVQRFAHPAPAHWAGEDALAQLAYETWANTSPDIAGGSHMPKWRAVVRALAAAPHPLETAHAAGEDWVEAVADRVMCGLLSKQVNRHELIAAIAAAPHPPAAVEGGARIPAGWHEGDLPAGIVNPEAWPPNYADGFNDALRIAYEVMGVTIEPPLAAAPRPPAAVQHGGDSDFESWYAEWCKTHTAHTAIKQGCRDAYAARPAQPAASQAGEVDDEMVERAREAYYEACPVEDGAFTNATAMRAALTAALTPQPPSGGEGGA